jgi:hypothetical protein
MFWAAFSSAWARLLHDRQRNSAWLTRFPAATCPHRAHPAGTDKTLEEAIQPSEVAAFAADAVAAGKFWVFTGQEWVDLVARRWNGMAEGKDPQLGVQVPGMPPTAQLADEVRNLLARCPAASDLVPTSASGARSRASAALWDAGSAVIQGEFSHHVMYITSYGKCEPALAAAAPLSGAG